MRRLKKVEALPAFEQSVLSPERGDTIEADEMWAYVGSKKTQAWVWLSWSFQTTQTLSFAVGPRDTATGREMWNQIPHDWKRKQVYTDALNIYDSLIPYRQHWVHAGMNGVCHKGSADTNIAEGCNNYLRHRVSYLVRESPSFARKSEWLYRRIFLVLYNRNQQIKQKALKKLTTGQVT